MYLANVYFLLHYECQFSQKLAIHALSENDNSKGELMRFITYVDNVQQYMRALQKKL